MKSWWFALSVPLLLLFGSLVVFRQRARLFMDRRAQRRRQRKIDKLRDDMYPLW